MADKYISRTFTTTRAVYCGVKEDASLTEPREVVFPMEVDKKSIIGYLLDSFPEFIGIRIDSMETSESVYRMTLKEFLLHSEKVNSATNDDSAPKKRGRKPKNNDNSGENA